MDDPKTGYNIWWLYGTVGTSVTATLGWLVQAIVGRRKSELDEIIHGQKLIFTSLLTVVEFMSSSVRKNLDANDSEIWQARVEKLRTDLTNIITGNSPQR